MDNRVLRLLLVILNVFLALTAIAGGIGLMTGSLSLPLSYLEGSFFTNYNIPGLSLSILVGIMALIAAVLVYRRHPFATLACFASAGAIIIFEIVEVLVIGSPAGIARTLQVFYMGLGVIILGLALVQWNLEHKFTP